MKQMNQNSHILNLVNFTDNNTHPFGNQQGKATFAKLKDFIDEHPMISTLGISLAEIKVSDASFPRESVISIAQLYRGTKGIYLVDIQNRDILDNWNYAAKAKDQPIIVWNNNSYEILGPSLTSSSKELLDYVLTRDGISVSQAAADLGISVQNASTRLKKLVMEGYILRDEVVAESGGIEYKYYPIK